MASVSTPPEALESPGDETVRSGSNVDEKLVRDRVSGRLFGDGTTPSRVGRFVLLERLGIGNMGAVYSAYDEKLDRKVAIKILHHRDSKADASLLKEARNLARVAHPNVVAVHDVGDDPGGVYLAMEFVRGVDLRRWIKQDKRPWTEVLDAFMQAGRGLAAAHAAGVMHRDFKPANILLSDDGRVRVVDFGLARAAHRADPSDPTEAESPQATETGTVMGTPAYMAHECWVGGRIDELSDQFAFCVSVFEAVYGRRPFQGNTVPEIAEAVAKQHVSPPPDPDVAPRWLHEVIVRGLDKDPAQRWPSMKALLDELNRQRRRRRNSAPIIVGVAAAAGAGALAWAVLEPEERSTLCDGGQQQLDVSWSPERKGAAADAFATAQPAFGEQGWARVEAKLEQYAASWLKQYVGLCEATYLRGELSMEKLDVRMRCLQRRWRRFDALVEVFTTADPKVVRSASAAVERLESPAGCADADVGPVAGPEPPPQRVEPEVHAVRLVLEEARAQLDAGRYADALATSTGALERARKTTYAPLVAQALWQLGGVQNRRNESEAALEHTLESFHTAYAARLDDLAATAAEDLVFIRGEQRELADALRWAKIAEAGLERQGGDPEDYAELWSSLGAAYLEGGEIDAALEYTRKAVEAREDGDHPLALAASLNNLGAMYSQAGRAEDATMTLRSAVALREEHQGPQHPQVFETLNTLAVALSRTGNIAEADAAFARVLEGYEMLYGAQHPEFAKALNNRAISYSHQGRYEEALADNIRALKIREEALGPDDPQAAYSYTNIAFTLRRMGDSSGALVSAERALEIFSGALSPDHQLVAQVQRNIGALQEDLGEHDKAVEHYRIAIATFERASTSSAYLPSTRNNLAGVLREQGLVREALQQHDAALAQVEATKPVSPRSLSPILIGRAETLLELERKTEALSQAERAIELLQGDDPRRRGDAFRILAMCQHALGTEEAVIEKTVAAAVAAYDEAPPLAQPRSAALQRWWKARQR